MIQTRTTFSLLLAFIFLTAPALAQVDFTGRIVAENLSIPWDMLEGPDGKIWFTERVGLVSRVDPETKVVDTLFDMRKGILNLVEVGLLSMILHPDFADTPYVYLSYVFRDTDAWVKHVSRYRYDGKTLVDEKVLYELRPAELWHQGCRMTILPDRTLMFTNGDQPAPDSTYTPTSEIGKILRIHLDGTIPSDNPYPSNRVWSRGHRNPQGLCVLPNGLVFSSEHGDKIEDEINLIRKDGNYGWPKVEGMCDTPEELEFCADNNVVQPVWSSGYVQTYAPAGLEYYGHTRYPALTGKLISTHLKSSRIMTHTLSDDQERIIDTRYHVQYRYGRIRDVLVMRDGRVFICTGNKGYKNIEPFPKATDDHIIELLPVWEHGKPIVKAQFDTIIYRTNVGDTVRTFVPFCGTNDAAVNYLRFQTNPGNLFQERHWQDAATTEGQACWPFRVLYVPDTAYPQYATATAWYDNRSGGTDSITTVLIGLPYRPMVHALKSSLECTSISDTCAFVIELENIGDTAAQITGFVAEPATARLTDTRPLPLTLEPGRRVTFNVVVDSSDASTGETAVRFVTNGLQDPHILLQYSFVSDTTSLNPGGLRGVAPFPVQRELIIHNVPQGVVTLVVYDVQGRAVFTTTLQSTGTIRIPTNEFISTADQYGAFAAEVVGSTGIQRHFFIVVQ